MQTEFSITFFERNLLVFIQIWLMFVPDGPIDKMSPLAKVMAWYSTGITHCGLVIYGSMDLGQHWHRKWLFGWRHQAITWTNVDLSSVRSSDIQLRAISQDIHQPSIIKISMKITYLKFHSNVQGANEQSGTKPNLVAKILATNFGVFFVICVIFQNIYSMWI